MPRLRPTPSLHSLTNLTQSRARELALLEENDVRRFLLHNISWIVFSITLALLVSHMVGWTQFTVDSTTLLLLALLLVSPFIEHLRKIKVGEFEAEIAPSEVEKVKSEVSKRLGPGEFQEPITPKARSLGESLLDLLDGDYVLALAKLRIELERALTRLYFLTTPSARRHVVGLNHLVSELVRSGILPTQLSGPLREVISLCNRAIHGEYVRPADARGIVDIGIRILEEIDSILEEFIIKPAETQPLSPADVSAYMGAQYRVMTVVPLVENPVLNVRILDQEGLNTLLEGYNEYAEFLVGIEKVETRAE